MKPGDNGQGRKTPAFLTQAQRSFFYLMIFQLSKDLLLQDGTHKNAPNKKIILLLSKFRQKKIIVETK